MTTIGATPEDLTSIFNQHRDRLRRYALSLLREDPGEADDVVQETFMRAGQGLAALKDPEKLSSWLYRIATNLCYDRFRHRSSRAHPQPLERTDVTEPPDPKAPRLDKLFEQKEMSACVQGYLNELPDAYRAVILLHDMEGLTNPEIAEMLGCSLATAKIRLHRARARLKEALANACRFSLDERGVTVCERKPQSPD